MSDVNILTYVNAPEEMGLQDIFSDFEIALANPGAKVTVVDSPIFGETVVLYTGTGTPDDIIKALAEE